MIRTGVKIQLALFLLISLVGTSYVGANYVGIGKSSYTVKAHFVDSGGVFSNAEVSYRGIRVGQVGPLHLVPDGVVVDLLIDKGRKIPVDTKAAVDKRSAVGEQYVNLSPQTASPPYLRAGSEIPLANTSVPLGDNTFLLNLDRLVNSIDRQQLSIVIDELGKAFSDAGPDLQRLIDRGNQLTQAAIDTLPQQISLLDSSKTVLNTQRETSSEIIRFNAALASLTEQIRISDPDIRAIFDNGVQSAGELNSLLTTLRPTLPILLGNLVTVGQIQAVPVRIAGLKVTLTEYPISVKNGTIVTPPGSGIARFGIVTQDQPKPCGDPSRGAPADQGYPTPRRGNTGEGADVGGKPHLESFCRAPSDVPPVRGARNAPRPPGDVELGTAGNPNPQVSFPGLTEGMAVQAASFDPATGVMTAPDGQQLSLGSQGGQQQIFGKDGWKWLLLAPLAG